jgi:hypothetical protein
VNHKIALSCTILLIAVTAFSQRRPAAAQADAAKPVPARLMVQGSYEEIFNGSTSYGNAQGKLIIKFEAARWLTMGTNEVGDAEFSELRNAPVPIVSGSASYEGHLKGSDGGDNHEATSNFNGPLGPEDVVLSIPEYTDTGNGFKIKVLINPKLKGKCSYVAVRGGETATATGCQNGTYFFSAATPVETDDNEDPARTADTPNVASFGIQLDIEPAAGLNSGTSSADDAGYSWRGAVTNGSREAGFKITLIKTKELPSADSGGHSTRRLVFNATIIPGVPK